MCGRVSQYSGIQDFVAVLGMPNALLNHAGDQPFERYNAAPSTQLALFHRDGEYLRADLVRWGWRPQWANSASTPINAHVETVAHRPFFSSAWPHRAIIAIDNWFEWLNEGGPKKQPYLIRHRDRTPILCAAIGQYPKGAHESGTHDGFVILTADSAGGMVDIDDRRPVTLSAELAREWLDPATSKQRAELMALLEGESTEAFEWLIVDHAVGNVQNQQSGLILPRRRPQAGDRLDNG